MLSIIPVLTIRYVGILGGLQRTCYPFTLLPFNLIILTSILVTSVLHSWYCLALAVTASTIEV